MAQSVAQASASGNSTALAQSLAQAVAQGQGQAAAQALSQAVAKGGCGSVAKVPGTGRWGVWACVCHLRCCC